MMRGLLLGAAVYGSVLSAYTPSSVSTASRVQCSTAYGSGSVAPTPIPTSDVLTTLSSFFTEAAATEPSGYTRVTAPLVTTTQHTSFIYSVILATVYSGIYTSVSVPVTTIATATWPVTTCTNGVNPKTVTKYTGTYKPVPGQATALPATYPTSIFCTTSVTEFVHLFPTVSSGVGTINTTPTTTIYDYTMTATSTITYLTVTLSSSTISITSPTYVETGHAVPTRTSCAATVTKTLDARCAPTNLISSHNNIGLVSGRYNGNVSVVYTRDEPWGTDPSLCCQLCLDNPGCGASMWGPYETCGLYYHGDQSGHPQCDFIFTYGSEAQRIAGQGIIVTEGCGTIEYE